MGFSQIGLPGDDLGDSNLWEHLGFWLLVRARVQHPRSTANSQARSHVLLLGGAVLAFLLESVLTEQPFPFM